ncbi:hypothetical protein H0A61_02686 [Koleobacter methoxysyntrophicus]|jgi:hypothetical protein|uniref:Uncharacterized protein n=1 Tax=Koleobacter methoxysyntrophicus TaxID=2751313 RepID=A0A8A0RPG2_9FIRM|nr:hypothetical protein [Koleobacter methoxysyntrophicus]QSQ10285.1 hypothetical protein H0A61_02686 [Koleobacter methoxysyntrophicus]
MKFIRKVANSDILAGIIDIPEELKSKKVEIIILPYENMDNPDLEEQKKKNVRGALTKYKNKELQEKEKEAWANAAVRKHENS